MYHVSRGDRVGVLLNPHSTGYAFPTLQAWVRIKVTPNRGSLCGDWETTRSLGTGVRSSS